MVRYPIKVGSIFAMFGAILGVSVVFLFQVDVTQRWLFVLGAFIGVVFEEGIKWIFARFREINLSQPLHRTLGTIATEESSIIIHSFLRPLDSELFRTDSDRQDLPRITGSPNVYGRGDAIALSLVHKAIERATFGTLEANIEDASNVLDEWGRSFISIGAHNRKTREILSKFSETFFKFDRNYSVITSTKHPPNFNPQGIPISLSVKQKAGNDSSTIDYGVILKLLDEFHSSKKTIIIIAGLGDMGTAGAAYFLLNHYSQLPYDQETFGVLIEVPSGYKSARLVQFEDVASKRILDYKNWRNQQ